MEEILLKTALDRGFFGEGFILYAFEDGNMFAEEKYAKIHASDVNKEYFVLSKESKKDFSKKDKK